MDIASFMASVDAHMKTTWPTNQQCTEKALLEEIGRCFPPEETSRVHSIIKQLQDDILLRSLCDSRPLRPYYDVAQALKLASRVIGTSRQQEVYWETAIKLAIQYQQAFASSLPDDQLLAMNEIVSLRAKAIMGLRELCYQVSLPDQGGAYLPDTEIQRLSEEIDHLANLLGGITLMSSAVDSMKSLYSVMTGRFKLCRDGRTVRIDPPPQLPTAYLYQLGIRYFGQMNSAGAGKTEFNRLIKLLTHSVGLLDLESTSMELIFARYSDTIQIMQKSLMYDAVFCLPQAKPAHVEEWLRWLIAKPVFSALKSEQGWTAEHVLSITLLILRRCKSAPPSSFLKIHTQEAAFATGLDTESVRDLLQTAFSHPQEGANRSLTFPPKDTDIDSAFRPILDADNEEFILQPPSLSARCVLNAVLDWCRNQWLKSNKKKFDESLGDALEVFVRELFEVRGMKIAHGEYECGKDRGQCDLVVQTDKFIIFFELKAKILTRQSRTGDAVNALRDLGESLVRPLAQAMERHAFLCKHGKMDLMSQEGPVTIEINGREVLKVSISRGELGSIHDRPFIQHFLRTGCTHEFQAEDSKSQKNINSLHKYFERFKQAAIQAGEYNLDDRFIFSKCWSLSLFQLLQLLERAESNEGFTRELLRTRYMSTPLRDFYSEYEYKVWLDEQSFCGNQ
jgi:Holliday junction resolvase-like predicted endonuclease